MAVSQSLPSPPSLSNKWLVDDLATETDMIESNSAMAVNSYLRQFILLVGMPSNLISLALKSAMIVSIVRLAGNGKAVKLSLKFLRVSANFARPSEPVLPWANRQWLI